jgi:hypothetical protein
MSRPLATVLYEDQIAAGANGSYPLHDLVMRLVEDDIDGETWRLRKLVAPNPRKGLGNILKDVKLTALLAGGGELHILVDVDRIREHLDLEPSATNQAIVAALRQRSDAPGKLRVHFLMPNVEGLLRSIQACDPTLLPREMTRALQKKLNDRDIVFIEVAKQAQVALRRCVRKAQPGIDALASALAALVPARMQWP